jgi:hypothetical protein
VGHAQGGRIGATGEHGPAANDMRSRKRAAGAILHEAALKRFELQVSGLELRLKRSPRTPR